MTLRRFVVCAAALLALAMSPVFAQPAYPGKPIRVIVPIAAGRVTDIIMRAAAPLTFIFRIAACGTQGLQT